MLHLVDDQLEELRVRGQRVHSLHPHDPQKLGVHDQALPHLQRHFRAERRGEIVEEHLPVELEPLDGRFPTESVAKMGRDISVQRSALAPHK